MKTSKFPALLKASKRVDAYRLNRPPRRVSPAVFTGTADFFVDKAAGILNDRNVYENENRVLKAIQSNGSTGGGRFMNSADLSNFIETKCIDAEILIMDGHTPTVEDAARELEVSPDQIIKSLVFEVRGTPILVINNGLARIDRKKLADLLEIGRKWVRFASPEQAFEVTGFVVGSMPPFGHLTRLRTLVDSAVLDQDVVYGGGGGLNAMMRLTPSELLRVTGAEVVPVSE